MAEELEELEDQEINKTEKRIKDLSEKVKQASQERDEKDQLFQKEQAEKTAALKEVEFYKDFSKTTSTYPTATEYQDKIKEKVMAGYTVEDAAVAVLAKEGKLGTPIVKKESPLGGSATNANAGTGDKSIRDMTRDEKRQALLDAESKGDISLN